MRDSFSSATNLPEPSKLAAIRNGRGEITGHIRLYWSPALKTYVSIPGYAAAEGR
jgi:hypothetical protein